MIRWVNILHIYQPPWQRADMMSRVTNESYRFLVESLEQYRQARMTFNVSGTLIDHLCAIGFGDLIARIRSLAGRGQLELTGSSYSHAFLPRLPQDECRHQIKLNEQTLEQHLGVRPKGFFLPELAYTPKLGRIIADMGYQWIVLDPMHATVRLNSNTSYRDRASGLSIIFRDRVSSRSYPPKKILERARLASHTTVVTATDGELYGHFHHDWRDHFRKALSSGSIITTTVSVYLASLTRSEQILLRPASWETHGRHVAANPFRMWDDARNPIHQALWKLAGAAVAAVADNPRDPNLSWARRHLDRGLASCAWWWASGVKTQTLAPVAWSPDETEQGARELIKSVRSLQALATIKKIQAEKIYAELLKSLWAKHWKTYEPK